MQIQTCDQSVDNQWNREQCLTWHCSTSWGCGEPWHSCASTTRFFLVAQVTVLDRCPSPQLTEHCHGNCSHIDISDGFRHGLEVKPQKMSLSHHRETYWSRFKMWIVQNFQILIVSAVKICKQCLQTGSASSPRPLPGIRPGTPLRNFRPPDPLGYSPQWKFLTHTQSSTFPPCLCRTVDVESAYLKTAGVGLVAG